MADEGDRESSDDVYSEWKGHKWCPRCFQSQRYCRILRRRGNLTLIDVDLSILPRRSLWSSAERDYNFCIFNVFDLDYNIVEKYFNQTRVGPRTVKASEVVVLLLTWDSKNIVRTNRNVLRIKYCTVACNNIMIWWFN